MKIAVTGHTSGIGRALTHEYQLRGHDIIGLSRQSGNDIREIAKIAEIIEPCDVFINNSHSEFAQTELLVEIAKRWQNTNKHIIVISTVLTQDPVIVEPDYDLYLYRIQKVALEEMIRQIKFNDENLKITVVRPGSIATSPNKTVPPAADASNWARILVQTLDLAQENNLIIEDISLGPI
jgi:nucleoside-diphosphate-sugar epimerase